MKYLVTDRSYNRSTTEYLYKTMFRRVYALGGAVEEGQSGDRRYFAAKINGEKSKKFKNVLEDKISDIIAVNYKYDYFKRNVKVDGLKSVEYELLLAALIAADLEEDKKFALSRLSGPTYSVDGTFWFAMKPLAEKWREIVGFIPSYFAADRLKDFISYIVTEKRGGKVYAMGGKVYDVNYNLLSRAYLTGGDECNVVKEIILSGSGEVELSSPIPETDEFYLKQFFGDKIFFGKGYFC